MGNTDNPDVDKIEYTGSSTEDENSEALWYKDAVVYQLHVKAFFDSNGDGMGDFAGLIEKLDYVRDLGVNTIWLLPFYPSPMRDDGYDVADYRNVYEQYGTRNDLRILVREAHKRGLRIITELVVNHTSDQHPWFQAARRAPAGSSKRNYYVWSDNDRKFADTRIIFNDTETSNWAWDPVAKAYYWHRFFSHQPDLNYNNPNVLKAIFRVMRFWLDMGVDGFRLDAIPYLCVREGTSNENLPETHEVIRQLRAQVDTHYKNRLLLAEANQWPEDVREYFGEGNECHMAYHFPLMPRIYMAIAQEDRHPVVEIMQQTPDIPDNCQWAIFLRNHDELTLEMVTSKERDYMYKMYAADPRARINLGIRRRLAPLMENDRERIKLMNSLLLSMPGSPIVYYGDEIGMGDNIFLGDRNGVRTPMQWSPDRNAGFSRADPQRLYLPPIMDTVYGYEAVNVEAQSRDPFSLLNWTRRMLAVRKSSKAFGRGRLVFLAPGNRKILAYLREYRDEVILCVANLGRSAQPVELDLSNYRGRVPLEMMGRTAFPPIGELPYLLTLPSCGFYWFRLTLDVEVPSWYEDRLPPDELPVLVLFDGWTSLFRDRVVPWRIRMAEKLRTQFEVETLPRYISTQRWYAAKGVPIRRAYLNDWVQWGSEPSSWLIAMLKVENSSGESTYFLPMTLAWGDSDDEQVRGLAAATLARVRQQSHVGVLADAFAEESFCRSIVDQIVKGGVLSSAHGQIRFTPTKACSEISPDLLENLPMGRPKFQGSNTVVTLGEKLFLKGYRNIRTGINPEFEVGRFLTEVANFDKCVPVAGVMEYIASDGVPMSLALLQGHVANQGDGWSNTMDYLERFIESRLAAPVETPADVHGAYMSLVSTLALRTAELHKAFSIRSGDPAFDPEEMSSDDLISWKRSVQNDLNGTLALLDQHKEHFSEQVKRDTDSLLKQKNILTDFVEKCAMPAGLCLKTRYHGDYHLGQVLVSNNDFYIIDFEGEPARPLAERRAKHSALRDVAGMLRSFDYARWSAVLNESYTDPERIKLMPLLKDWEREACNLFIYSYGESAVANGLYEDFEQVNGLIRLFELEKALYELRYEIGNRPAWINVPMNGILALCGVSTDGVTGNPDHPKGE
ncbi:MAG: maltose alpha-D-glucosyltransferase [Desulfuromonadaceae bacterium]|nr:maltose alpha-D-glucosyltransferase [Desulfuromonadaceae bacterium]MDD2856146.1 maltose alpha-D-glucosyltransferase [Desulfuromonadaceae bacterium]